MERAPPVSFGRRAQPFIPSRPVPPPRTSRYSGPQARSFAAGVRQGNQRSARRFVSPRVQGSEQVRRQAAEPARNRGARPFIPSRPVPPPRTSRYSGPQARSFAAVVRQGNQRPARRFVSPRVQGSEEIRREAAEPAFRLLTQKMNKLIKMVHHLQNVDPTTEKEQPKMISKMIDMLSTMIRPAAPMEDTAQLIRGNAENWGYNTLIILKEHYERGLKTLVEGISTLLVPDWKEQFRVATRWAKWNLPHISQGAIDHAEALIIAGGDSTNQPRVSTTVRPDQPRQANVTVATMTEEPSQEVGQVSKSVQVEPPSNQVAQLLEEEEGGLDRESPSVAMEQQRTTVTVATMTDGPDQELDRVSQSSRVEFEEVSAQEQGRDGPRTIGGVVLSDDWFMDGGSESEGSVAWSLVDPLADEDLPHDGDPPEDVARQELEDLFGCSPSRRVEEAIVMTPHDVSEGTELGTDGAGPSQVQAEVLPQAEGVDRVEDETFESLYLSPSPRSQVFRVTRHANSDRKMIDWGLTVTKRWLMVGDSNLSRFPTHDIHDLQIDSYPGANFRHAEALMKKAVSSVAVEKVVLSFGLNSRSQKVKETAVKQLQAALRETKKKFPFAQVFVPLINFSAALAEDEKRTLRLLNVHIQKNMPFLPALPTSLFCTGKDNVHWTKGTAKAILEHWSALLNLTAL